jgi:hypothetical protein
VLVARNKLDEGESSLLHPSGTAICRGKPVAQAPVRAGRALMVPLGRCEWAGHQT